MSEMKSPARKITNSSQFCSDLSSENQLHGILIRSPVAAGKFISADFNEQTDNEMKSKCRILTAKDLPAKKTIEMCGAEAEIFCIEKIKYKGEPLGILLCEDEVLAANLIKENKIKITIEEENSPEEKKSLLSNTLKSENFDENIFTNADFVVSGEWKNDMKSLSMKEPDAAFIVPFTENGTKKIIIHAPSHWISNAEKTVSEVTGISKENIFIDRTNISIQNTNAIFNNSLTIAQAAVSAYITKRPVKLIYSRDEQEKFIENVAEIVIKHTTALDKNGKILGMDVKITADFGYLCPFAKEISDRLMISSMGIYKAENFRVNSELFTSNNAPKSVKLSAIAMHSFFAIENQILKIADHTRLSPLEIKLLNVNFSSKLIQPLHIESVLDSVIKPLDKYLRIEDPQAKKDDMSKTIKEEEENFSPSDFSRKYAAYIQKGKNTTIQQTVAPYIQDPKGISVACAIEGNGYIQRNLNLKTEMTYDGKFIIDSLAISPSNWNIWTSIVNESLKIDRGMIFLNPTVQTSEENNWPDTLCENVSVKTFLLKECCKEMLNGKQKVCKNLSEYTPADQKFFSASFAACTIEIGINPCNLEVFIEKINVALDCGKIYSKQTAESSVRLEIQKILPQLIKDERVKCKEINVRFIDSESEPKQIGHLMHSIIPAAFTGALSVALGRAISTLPVTKEGILNVSEIQD